MKEFVFYIISFGVVYSFYLFFIVLRKKSLDKFKQSKEVLYLTLKYKLNTKKINYKSLANIVGLANAFVIATTLLIISFINKFIVKLLAGTIILVPLIIIVYHLIGTTLKRKERR